MTISSKKLLQRAVATAALCAVAPLAHASEELFVETYLADTLPKGVFEAEQAVTYREGKSEGTYKLWQTRSELEWGITDRWQLAGYVNAYSVEAQNDNSQASRTAFNTTPGADSDEVSGGGPATFGNYVAAPGTRPIPAANYRKTDFDSLSVETIYKILNVYTDPIGLSAYAEFTGGDRTQEIELKALLQKNYLDDRLVLAANAVVEFERDSYSLTGTTDRETEVEFTGGASYRFAQNWRAGGEIRNIRGYTGHSIGSGDRSYSVVYLGPQVSYTGIRWFTTLGYQRQMPWAEGFDTASRLEQVSGMNYKEWEANLVRLRVGFNFK